MCGIFALLNQEIDNDIYNAFLLGQNRGPEDSVLVAGKKEDNYIFGFHRLAINGLNSESSQPLRFLNCKLICNGEIYNYKELEQLLDIKLNTQSDCEIIIHLYRKFGIVDTLKKLDGVFAFILLDEINKNIFVARDRFGVRPLFEQINEQDTDIYGFASEVKVLKNLSEKNETLQNLESGRNNSINTFLPGTYKQFIYNHGVYEFFCSDYYYNYPSSYLFFRDESLINHHIVDSFEKAIKKRVVDTTDRPIACLLSGGLDSSIVCALVAQYYGNNNLETYSIGLEGSEDLKYAQLVADFLGTKHTNVIVSETEFFQAIPEVIYAIESYDTTTVRASVGNYLIGKYIKENSEAKVIFNGDGSDELMGGYIYFNSCPNSSEFDKECKRLLNDIHYFDVLRSDRCISTHGLEPRTPFLDYTWVNAYLSIEPNQRFQAGKIEKYLFRNAFQTLKPGILPEEILWRNKEAFSDGVSSLNRSWYEIIDEKVKYLYKFNFIQEQIKPYLTEDNTLEKAYYRFLYEKHFKNLGHLIPYFWMPKFVEANDASARTLKTYNKPLVSAV
jgi:asparagine synthase (glutamine-hydrolysing)